STGNCAHCHEQHASVSGSSTGEPLPTGGPDSYLGMEIEQDLCLHCHGRGGNTPLDKPDDIKIDIEKNYGHGPLTLSTPSPMEETGVHRARETSVTAISTDPHVECTDCHNPHVARKLATRSKGSNAISNPNPLEGVSGIDFDIYPTWSAAGTPNVGGYSTADKEYKICFKCHSSANSNLASWDNPAGGPLEWTDVAKEFNPANKSFHPVITGLGSGSSNSTPLATAQMKAAWQNVGTQTMYCSDCHAGEAATGPHGSSVRWMLAGPNKAWPFTQAQYNGASPSPAVYRTLDEWNTNKDTANGTFCNNCHALSTSGADNEAHNPFQHSNTRCVDCHIRIPHGGKVSRLIAADNNATFTNLPARYTADGNGHNAFGGTAPIVRKFTKAPNRSAYARESCYVPSCAYHGSAGYGNESW
ncbi:MAG: hypothetical protein OEV73_12425, partial [Desulfobulbaceae bacterium]|nr:hypothetical protein [Desulfobulbaceae bacterium]